RVLPSVLKRFAQSHLSVAVDVTIDQSANLRRRLSERELDITLFTVCRNIPPDAEILLTEPIVWGGARGGCAYLKKPLLVSVWEEGCAWRADALEALCRDGVEYRVAYMSAHTAGQRAAILADLAIAPLPRSFIGNDIVPLGPEHGLPQLSNYNLAMIVAPDASAPVRAAADHIRATMEAFREAGRF